MREIKFRAWDKEKKEMVHFENQNFCDEYNQLTFDVVEENRKEYLGCLKLENSKSLIMQFTGIKDKNGKEIYEGDIIYINERGFKEVWSVEWDCFEDGKWYACNQLNSCREFSRNVNGQLEVEVTEDYKFEPEVVGNIYENPELLT